MAPFYEEEMPTGEFLPLSRALAGVRFINNFGITEAMLEEEYKKARSSLPWPGFETKFDQAWSRGLTKCESPIEKLILPWLLQISCQFFDYNPTVLFAGEADQYKPGTLALIPQLPIGRFRVDFALAASLGGAVRFFVIECDGKEFHDGVANVRRDVDRDVAILANKRVLDVFRIEGRHIISNPQQAAWMVARAVFEAWRKK